MNTFSLPGDVFLAFQSFVASSGYGTVIYDGDSDPDTLDSDGLGGVDLTQGGTADHIKINVKEFDFGGVTALDVAFSLMGVCPSNLDNDGGGALFCNGDNCPDTQL